MIHPGTSRPEPRNVRFLLVLLGLVLAWFVTFLFGMKVGVFSISFSDLWAFVRSWFSKSLSDSSQTWFVVCSLRLQRLLLASLSGFVLSLCGVVMQGLFRTPLADPYLLGVIGGSTCGAALMICLGLGESLFFLPLGAFLGGLLAVVLVSLVAFVWAKRHRETNVLLLAGIAFSSLFSSVTSFLVFFAPQRMGFQSLMFWLLGSFSRSQWSSVGILFCFVLFGSPWIFLCAKELNILSLGDDMAIHMGVSPRLFRNILLFVTTLLTAGVVSAVGPIGFVGLLVPHATRLLLGPNHARLLPAAALLGAIFLPLCDTLARLLFAPSLELPVGMVTALLGAPCLLFLLLRKQGK